MPVVRRLLPVLSIIALCVGHIAIAAPEASSDDQIVPAPDDTASVARTASSKSKDDARSQSFVAWAETAIVRNSRADEGAVESSEVEMQMSDSSSDNIFEGPGIPGAVVAVIFGVFGLLVVARRTSTSR